MAQMLAQPSEVLQMGADFVDNGAMFRRSLDLVKASWSVIKGDRQLLWLPLISGLASLIVIGTFAVPVILSSHSTTNASGSSSTSLGPIGYVFIALGYFVLAYITIYFRTAMICAANRRLDGGEATLNQALTDARQHAGKILPWAIVSATVSLVLQAVEQKAGFLGRIVVSLIGAAWSLVTFLVLPVLVLENVGVGTSIKRSVELFKHTWGENMIGNGGIGLIGMLACIPGALLVFVGIASGSGAVLAIMVILGVAWIALVVTVASAMTGVFMTALYRFATTGEGVGPYSSDMLTSAFKPKKNRGFGNNN
jgi:hypothetical protein